MGEGRGEGWGEGRMTGMVAAAVPRSKGLARSSRLSFFCVAASRDADAASTCRGVQREPTSPADTATRSDRLETAKLLKDIITG